MTTPTQTLDTRPMIPWLVAQQQRVLGILDGLDDQALRQPVLPSGWSCLGMLQHLARMNRFWFADVMTGQHVDEAEGDDFSVAASLPTSAVFDAYARETSYAVAVIRDLPPSTPPVWWPNFFGEWRLDTLHEVVLHVLVETTCHAGHLDAARELLDGRTWDYEHGQLGAPVPGTTGRR